MAIWDNLKFGIGGGYDSQGIGQGLINVQTKKEQTTEQNTYQTSTTDIFSPTDTKTFTYTNAPTIVLNSAGAEVSGSRQDIRPTTKVEPQITTKDELQSSQSATQSMPSGSNTLILIALGVGAFLLVKGDK